MALLLSGIGLSTYFVLRNLMTPDVPSSKTYDELKGTLFAHSKYFGGCRAFSVVQEKST